MDVIGRSGTGLIGCHGCDTHADNGRCYPSYNKSQYLLPSTAFIPCLISQLENKSTLLQAHYMWLILDSIYAHRLWI